MLDDFLNGLRGPRDHELVEELALALEHEAMALDTTARNEVRREVFLELRDALRSPRRRRAGAK